MSEVFIIEDEKHAEQLGSFPTLEKVQAELIRIFKLAWDDEPNRAPCGNWKYCGRNYEVVQYDTTSLPWKEISRTLRFTVSAHEKKWIE